MGEDYEAYEYEENVLSILRGGEGCHEKYSSVSEFKHHLNEDGLIEEKLIHGWVFERGGQQLDLYANNITKITALLKHLASDGWSLLYQLNGLLIQFWAAVEMEGGHHYLSTSNHPFLVTQLRKGACWFRNLCMGRVYGVGADADADAEQLGGVGRAYRSKQPETTPDLRLYRTSEFPLRDEAARCGFRWYMALPLFDFHHQNHCFGVLELLSINSMFGFGRILPALDTGLRRAGFRSTHIPMYHDLTFEKQHVESEIKEILELGIKAIPRLSHAQVWVPCKQCHNSRCLEIASFIHSGGRILNGYLQTGREMIEYLQACKFHNLQIDVSRLGQDLCEVSISKNPLAHYAERARLPQVFTICLQSVNNNNSNHFYVLEFFFQSNYGDGGSPLHLIFKILEIKLKSFKCVLGGKFLEEFVVQSRQPLNPNAFELESIDMLKAMDSCDKIVSESNFTMFLETDEICLFRPMLEHSDDSDDKDNDDDSIQGWVFCSPIEGKSSENNVNNHSLRVLEILIKKKIKYFMKELTSNFEETYCMVQFWAPAMVENRRCLKTLDQPFALSRLAKGVASFRNKCIKHHYFVDEKAKEDELGPIGRVFRNGYPELLYDIHSYSAKEFSMRNYGIHCGFENYFALPVFYHEHQQFKKHNCVGVLEFIGYKWCNWDAYWDLEEINSALEEQNLFCDIHSNLEANVYNEEAVDEFNNALSLINKIPQCYWVNAWVQNEKCMRNNSKCMERLNGRNVSYRHSDFTHVEPGIGMIGVVLESESKSCFCPNVYELVQYPSLYGRKLRHSSCFAICLQSLHTGDLLYVLEFFLYRVQTTLEYLMSFLNFLLPILKHELKSFKIASGKQLGEELVVEVIEFSETNQLCSYPNQLGGFPVKFKSVLYSQKEQEHIEEQQVQSNPEVGQRKRGNRDLASNVKKIDKEKRKRELVSQRKEENATEFLPLTLDILKPYMGKMNQDDVAAVFGVKRSTIKRFCRGHGIRKWPRIKNQARNSTFLDGESSRQVHMQPSSSNSHQVLDTSIQQTANTQHHQLVEDEQEKVMIKVRCERDTIKFESGLLLEVVKLHEEVGRRLKLKMGDFKLKYMDEDNEEILIACDEDLQLCPKIETSTGKTCIQLFVPK